MVKKFYFVLKFVDQKGSGWLVLAWVSYVVAVRCWQSLQLSKGSFWIGCPKWLTNWWQLKLAVTHDFHWHYLAAPTYSLFMCLGLLTGSWLCLECNTPTETFRVTNVVWQGFVGPCCRSFAMSFSSHAFGQANCLQGQRIRLHLSKRETTKNLSCLICQSCVLLQKSGLLLIAYYYNRYC